MKAGVGIPVRLGDRLNDGFVAAARALDRLLRRSGEILTGKRSRSSRPPAAAPPPQETLASSAALTQQARARLGDLHLRVGECIYQMASGRAEQGPVERQLRALLEEIERVEDILRQFGVKGGDLGEVGDGAAPPLAALDEESLEE